MTMDALGMDFLLKVLLTFAIYSQCYVDSAPRLRRLSVAEKSPVEYFFNNINGVPGAYSFNYDIADSLTGNTQYRTEDRYPNGTVAGAYGYVDAFGAPQRFRYIADQAGYRVYKEDRFQPFYGHQTTSAKPIDKLAAETTESSVTWTRPKKPKKNKNNPNQAVYQNYQKVYNGNRRYNLIGPPSLYAAYD